MIRFGFVQEFMVSRQRRCEWRCIWRKLRIDGGSECKPWRREPSSSSFSRHNVASDNVDFITMDDLVQETWPTIAGEMRMVSQLR